MGSKGARLHFWTNTSTFPTTSFSDWPQKNKMQPKERYFFLCTIQKASHIHFFCAVSAGQRDDDWWIDFLVGGAAGSKDGIAGSWRRNAFLRLFGSGPTSCSSSGHEIGVSTRRWIWVYLFFESKSRWHEGVSCFTSEQRWTFFNHVLVVLQYSPWIGP